MDFPFLTKDISHTDSGSLFGLSCVKAYEHS